MAKNINELNDPREYFPYIGHNIDHEAVFSHKLYLNSLGPIFKDGKVHHISDNIVSIDGSAVRSIFTMVKVKGIKSHISIAKDSNSVELFIPRHRSLYDYMIHMPVHVHFISPSLIFLAGHNLFVRAFDTLLRSAGGFMYLREDAVLKKKGLKNVFLSKDRYIDEVFSAYIRNQLFEGPGEDNKKMDLVIYPETEKDPLTNIRRGGRTKTGKLRAINPLFFDKIKAIAKDFPHITLYVTAMNISFSKIPEVPYIVHPTKYKGLGKAFRYVKEQHFTMVSYASFALKHPEARLEAIINFGEPLEFNPADFTSVRDLLKFSRLVKDKIGLLESIFPVTFLYRSLDQDTELSLEECKTRMNTLFDHYSSIGVDCEKISDGKGNMLPGEEIIEKSLGTMNTNPSYHVKGIRKNDFLELKSGRLFSYDPGVQAWYANNVRHLDPLA